MNQLSASSGQRIEASASACLSNEYSGLISLMIDWFDLLAVQGTLNQGILWSQAQPRTSFLLK